MSSHELSNSGGRPSRPRVGAALRRLRDERDISQQELATALGVSVGIVSRWERGANGPERAQLRRLAEFFSVDASALTDPDDERKAA